MNRYAGYIFFILAFSVTFLSVAQERTLTGIVNDIETKQPLGYCSVKMLNGSQGTITDADGKFKLLIPDTVSKLLIYCLAYENDTIEVQQDINDYTIFLLHTGERLNEIVITGVSKATSIRENPVAIISISAKAIEKTTESNIIDALVKNAPGLNAVKTGPNISKPFIRGLGYNRVLTLYDGIRQEGQQWGDEHGIEVDAYNVEKAEVIKGPASLLFGSDALAGVVSLMPYVPVVKDSIINGKIFSEYQNNNGLTGAGFRIGQKASHWLWAIRGSNRIAKNYMNSVDGRVYNTAFRENNVSMLLGYTSGKGSTNINFTLYDNLQGIPDGSRDSLTRKFTKQINEGAYDTLKKRPLVSDAELNSYDLSPLRQHIQHYRIYSNSHYQAGRGDIDALLALQQNRRREYDHPTDPGQAGMYILLQTLNYGFRYNAPRFLNTETTIGVNGMLQKNKNKDGTDFPIPDYTILDGGAYLFGKWRNSRWTISGGLRYDARKVTGGTLYIKPKAKNGFDQQVFLPDTAGARMQFSSFTQTFMGISSSIGVTYKIIDQISFKANIARGYRSPNISEIASNGLDPGAHIVYIGNKNFIPEFSFQQDAGIMSDFKSVSFILSVFNNYMQNYIYLAQLANAQGIPIVLVPGNKTFQYQQASAHLYGMEAMLSIHPAFMNGFEFNTNFSTVYGYNTKTDFKNKGVEGEYLPFIPPPKILSSISQEIKTKRKIIPSVNLKGEIDYTAAQDRYLALYQTETPTPAYTLFNAGFGIDINYTPKKILQFHFQVNNLLDAAYQSNLSRLKYFEYYSQSPGGHYGMYGMGRNFCFKLILGF